MPRQKTFVLGLGAQKCGTSWVHDYLSNAPACDMGAMKEYHIWDGMLVPELSVFRAGVGDVLRKGAGSGQYTRRQQAIRLAMQRWPGAYERYFARLARDGVWLTGDISPGYSALRAPALRQIRGRLEAVGFGVKVVFLMRDPVERCWSSVRMTRRNDGIGNRASESEAAHLAQCFSNPIFELRTNYHETIAAVDAVFDPGDVYYGLFEEMFKTSEVDRLSAFFGLSPDLSKVSRTVNASPKTDDLAPGLKAAIRAHYSAVYDVCRARFPQTAELWSQP